MTEKPKPAMLMVDVSEPESRAVDGRRYPAREVRIAFIGTVAELGFLLEAFRKGTEDAAEVFVGLPEERSKRIHPKVPKP